MVYAVRITARENRDSRRDMLPDQRSTGPKTRRTVEERVEAVRANIPPPRRPQQLKDVRLTVKRKKTYVVPENDRLAFALAAVRP